MKFASNQNAHLHFTGVSHENRVRQTQINARNKELSVSSFWCEICCCELNTQQMLDIHKQSPKHSKKLQVLDEIMKLKDDYMRMKNSNSTSTGDNDNKSDPNNNQ